MPKSIETTSQEPLGARAHRVAPLIDQSPTKVKELIRDGVLESVKIGRSRIVTMRSIKALLHREPA